MNDVEIRDDRANGRLEAFIGVERAEGAEGAEGEEPAGHIRYFVLASP